MRLFLALDVPADSAREIAAWRERSLAVAGRPVPMANYHVTLAFIGELPDTRLEPLCDALDERLAGPVDSLPALHLDQLGYWPRPGIVWLGSAQPPPVLAELARRLGTVAERFGARRERRPYVPHVTLYRNVEAAPPAAVSAPGVHLRQSRVTLFESLRQRAGVVYRPVAEWALGPGPQR